MKKNKTIIFNDHIIILKGLLYVNKTWRNDNVIILHYKHRSFEVNVEKQRDELYNLILDALK